MRLLSSLWVTFVISGCATLNDSLQFGGGLGLATGATAVLVGNASADHRASLGDAAIGAGIGTAVGLITSYFIYKQADEQRQSYLSDQTEMHFGDLPPSPFIVPKMTVKKGAR